MALPLVSKIQVAVVTATVTSAIWIVVCSFMLDGNLGRPPPADTSSAAPLAVAAPIAQASKAGQASAPGPAELAQLAVPVLDMRPADLVDSFTDERGAGTRLHEALDIMAPAGTSVVAAAPGKVEKLFRSNQGGNTIYVRSDDGKTIYYYAHLQAYAPGLREGQKIRRGQRLGSVGSTGNADPAAPHLHFAVMRTSPDAQWWEPSVAINPYPLLTGR